MAENKTTSPAVDEITQKNGKKSGLSGIDKQKKDERPKQWGDDFIEELSLSLTKMRSRVPLKNLVFFTRQLSTMFAAGLTLEKSLNNLANEEKHTKFKKVLQKVANDIRKGSNLSDALERHPGVFNSLYIALVKAGELSGSLQTILDQLATYLENTHETNQKVKSALYYPIIVFAFLIVVILVMLVFIVPKFSDVYTQLGAKLPGPTQALVHISNLVTDHFVAAIGMVFLAVVILWMVRLTRRGGYAVDGFLLKFPVFGTLITYSIYQKFSKTLGILLGAGVPVIPSMHLMKRIVGNRVYEKAIGIATEFIRDGYNISAALRHAEKFPPIMLQLTSTGEETGEIDSLLDKSADFYGKQVDSMVSRMTSLIEPLMIMFVGGMILVILVVTYLPIFYIGQAMRSGM